jgi:predicted DCC family thiol-disulfide oxidoreductase YuxK
MEMDRIILFDGQCGLCVRSVKFVIERDRNDCFRFASLQSRTGKHLAETHGIDAAELKSLVLIEEGSAFTRSEAGLRILKRLSGPVRILAVLQFVPRVLRDRAYRFVARYRYAWFGRYDACWIPSDPIHDRFLE